MIRKNLGRILGLSIVLLISGFFTQVSFATPPNPFVLNVTSTSTDGFYKDGVSINITVQFSESVTVAGEASPFLNTNSGQAAFYISGSGSDTLTFEYHPVFGANVEDLDVGNLAPNGFTDPIKDTASGLRVADLTVPTGAGTVGSLAYNKNITIDNTAPTLISASVAGAHQVDLTFSEPVISTTTDYTNFAGVLSGHAITALATSGAVVSLTFDGAVINTATTGGLDIVDSSITDRAGNAFEDYAEVEVRGLYVFAQGNGLDGTPYEINSCIALAAVNQDLTASYKLMATIDCTEFGNDVMIGDQSHAFTGSFDGDDHTITIALNVPTDYDIGLFRFVDEGGAISNLTLIATVQGDTSTYMGALIGRGNGMTLDTITVIAEVTGASTIGGVAGDFFNSTATDVHYQGTVIATSSSAGGLFGQTECGSTISHSHATGTVSGADRVGGLTGSDGCEGPGGTWIDVSFSGSVEGSSDNVGGIIGVAYESSIVQAFASSTVEGASYVGGLVGVAYNGSIEESRAYGVITGDDFVGGLVGYLSNNDIETSYTVVDIVASGESVGGLAGYILGGSYVANTYARGQVEGGVYVGGLVGYLETGEGDPSTVVNSYATGNVTGEAQGGFAGGQDGLSQTINSFWDIESSGIATSSGEAVGTSSVAMKTQSTFTTNLGEGSWDFDEIWNMDEVRNSGYPYFLWELGEEGDADFFIISPPESLTEGSVVDHLTVELGREPESEVTISFTASSSQMTFSETSLTFTPENWDDPQTVIVTPVNDTVVEGTHHDYIIFEVTSGDDDYNGFEIEPIAVTIHDNDTHHQSSGGSVARALPVTPPQQLLAILQAQLADLLKQLELLRAQEGVTVPNTFIRDLELGMRGEDVTALQRLLIAKNIGLAAQALSATGVSDYFGEKTKAAVIEYQKAKGIVPASGYFGRLTRATL